VIRESDEYTLGHQTRCRPGNFSDPNIDAMQEDRLVIMTEGWEKAGTFQQLSTSEVGPIQAVPATPQLFQKRPRRTANSPLFQSSAQM
jgi:hypothetical protein